jgi:arylsulfatase A-like enzyme
MNRREFIASVCATMVAPAVYGTARAQAKPNIVVILADDMGWADVGHELSKIDTPNLGRLERQGMKLTQFYAASPVCSPTRAALLTGRYPHSAGMPAIASPEVRGNVPILSLSHDAVTIPQALKPAGYTSMLAGKWHLGHPRENWPRTYGFDEFWGSLAGTPGYYTVKDAYHNETPIEVDGYFTDRITDKAIEFIEKTQDKPFFLFLSYNAPHYPLEAPQDLIEKYKPRYDHPLFPIYAAMVDRLDFGIGRVMKTLDKLGLDDNTLVLFTADNGPSPQSESYGLSGAKISAGPLKEHKMSTHEGGIREPFIAWWPGRIPAGSVRHERAVIMDFMPTILDVAGAKLPKGYEIHGRSILSILTGKPYERTEPFHWETENNYGVLEGDWKLVHQFWVDKPYLYNLKNDLGERTNLAEKYPEKVIEMEALHKAWVEKCYPNQLPRITKRSTGRFPKE